MSNPLYLIPADQIESNLWAQRAAAPVAGVLDESYSQLTPLSGVTVQARQSTKAGTVSILCSLAGQYGYSAKKA